MMFNRFLITRYGMESRICEIFILKSKRYVNYKDLVIITSKKLCLITTILYKGAYGMQYRKLGKTGLEVSEIGMGLEHLLDKEESIIMVFHIILKNVESNNRRNRWYL